MHLRTIPYLLLLIICLLTETLAAQPLSTGTYTINGNLPSGGTNFSNFNAAKNALASGIAGPVVFEVVPNAGTGEYIEQVKFVAVAGSSPVNTITIKGNGVTLKFASTNTNERAAIKLQQAKHFIFDSLQVDVTGGTYGFGFQLIDNADSNIIRKCKIYSNLTATTISNYAGIVINGSHTSPDATGTTCNNNLFEKNIISGGSYGITCIGFQYGSENRNNTIAENEIIDFYKTGIYIQGGTNHLVKGNVISRPSRTNSATTVTGVHGFAGNSYCLFDKNIITNFFKAQPGAIAAFRGIAFESSQSGNKASNNVIFNVGGNGEQIGLLVSNTSQAIYHNTIILNDRTATTADAIGLSNISSGSVTFKNNAVEVSRNTTGLKTCIDKSPDASITSNYNNLYAPNGIIARVGYLTKPSLPEWQSLFNQDSNSLNENPWFDPTAAYPNLPRLFTYKLDNKGTNVFISDDVSGNIRSYTTPDIGASEFDAPLCNTSVPGQVTLVQTSGCIGTPITLNVTGNSAFGRMYYQWQATSDTVSGSWTNITDSLLHPKTTVALTGKNYFRAKVTCDGFASYTNIGMANPTFLLAGTYTIDSSGPPTANPIVPGANFRSFTEALAALKCGIGGKVIFNVVPAPGGVYKENVRIGKIPGTSATATVTFQSHPGNTQPSVVEYPTGSSQKYVFRLDSCSFVILRNLTVDASKNNTVNAIEITSSASNDTLDGLRIIAANNLTSTDTIPAGICTKNFTGSNIHIANNKITGGAVAIKMSGIYTRYIGSISISNNNISSFNNKGILVEYCKQTSISGNTILMAGSNILTSSSGISTHYCDSSLSITKNFISIKSTLVTLVGIRVSRCLSRTNDAVVSANRVIAGANNTKDFTGVEVTYSTRLSIINNEIIIRSAGFSGKGMYIARSQGSILNNSLAMHTKGGVVLEVATSGYDGYDIYLNIHNNVFYNPNGKVYHWQQTSVNLFCDYNLISYKNAIATLGDTYNPPAISSVNTWRQIADRNSVFSIKPPFINDSTLIPNVFKDSVWALQAGGIQIPGNNQDINGNMRADVITQGSPDLGAYEFHPAVKPPALQPVLQTTPQANTTQGFLWGADTILKVHWGATVPSTVLARFYPGIKPPAADSALKVARVYSELEMPDSSGYNFAVEHHYKDTWDNNIGKPLRKSIMHASKTGAWHKNHQGTTHQEKQVVLSNTILGSAARFGLYENAYEPNNDYNQENSNLGRKFWVSFPANDPQLYTVDMYLYFSSLTDALVRVHIEGTSFDKHYLVKAGTMVISDKIKKSDYPWLGNSAGVFNKGVSITSSQPIAVFAHVTASASSGSSMLMPSGTWGTEYKVVDLEQDFTSGNFMYINVIADKDSTRLLINPSVPVQNAGMAAGQFNEVILNRGQVLQVLSQHSSGALSNLSGTVIKSVPNNQGECYPFVAYHGSMRTAIVCAVDSVKSGGDFSIQQMIPTNLWGYRYLTTPQTRSDDLRKTKTNIYRILVSDTSAVVKVNGVDVKQPPLSLSLKANSVYEIKPSVTPDVPYYIESDKPIMVSQYLTGAKCGATTGDYLGDPESIYLTPISHGVKHAIFNRTGLNKIEYSFLHIIVPAGGLSSLVIKNNNAVVTPDSIYDHPGLPSYKVVIKRWSIYEWETKTTTVSSDSSFTAIHYGVGAVESYGYNLGYHTNLPITPLQYTIGSYDASIGQDVCFGMPASFKLRLTVKPQQLHWKLSKLGIPGMNDYVETAPLPADSTTINGIAYYNYNSPLLTPITAGLLRLPVQVTDSSIKNCSGSVELYTSINVGAKPILQPNISYSHCSGDTAHFTLAPLTTNAEAIASHLWKFSATDSSFAADTFYHYPSAGSNLVSLRATTSNGCVADSMITLETFAQVSPSVKLVSSLPVPGAEVVFTAQPTFGGTSPLYTFFLNNTAVQTGPSSTYSADSLAPGFTVTVTMQSSAGCATPGTASSNAIRIADYLFVGSGDWNNPANWKDGMIPPAVLPNGVVVVVNPSPGGSCVYNGNLTMQAFATLYVQPGVKLVVTGHIVVQ